MTADPRALEPRLPFPYFQPLPLHLNLDNNHIERDAKSTVKHTKNDHQNPSAAEPNRSAYRTRAYLHPQPPLLIPHPRRCLVVSFFLFRPSTSFAFFFFHFFSPHSTISPPRAGCSRRFRYRCIGYRFCGDTPRAEREARLRRRALFRGYVRMYSPSPVHPRSFHREGGFPAALPSLQRRSRRTRVLVTVCEPVRYAYAHGQRSADVSATRSHRGVSTAGNHTTYALQTPNHRYRCVVAAVRAQTKEEEPSSLPSSADLLASPHPRASLSIRPCGIYNKKK